MPTKDPVVRAVHELFPVGDLEGMPCLSLHVAEASADETREALELEFAARLTDGIGVVWIRQAPWDSHAFQAALSHAQSEIGDTEFVAIRTPGSTVWAPPMVNWVMDLSELMREKLSAARIEEVLFGAVVRPEVQFGAALDPAIENITQMILSGVGAAVDGLTLYTDEAGIGRFLPVAARSDWPCKARLAGLIQRQALPWVAP